MTRRDRLRRVAILCCTCIRNLAYYRAGWHQGDSVFDRTSEFEKTINNNFIDAAVLEWCKLFIRREQHSWHKVVSDKNHFQTGLLAQLDFEQAQFDESFTQLCAYRNRFLAHLDSDKDMQIPLMDTVKCSVMYYYGYLLNFENDGSTFQDGPFDLAVYFQRREEEARAFYVR